MQNSYVTIKTNNKLTDKIAYVIIVKTIRFHTNITYKGILLEVDI